MTADRVCAPSFCMRDRSLLNCWLVWVDCILPRWELVYHVLLLLHCAKSFFHSFFSVHFNAMISPFSFHSDLQSVFSVILLLLSSSCLALYRHVAFIHNSFVPLLFHALVYVLRLHSSMHSIHSFIFISLVYCWFFMAPREVWFSSFLLAVMLFPCSAHHEL